MVCKLTFSNKSLILRILALKKDHGKASSRTGIRCACGRVGWDGWGKTLITKTLLLRGIVRNLL